MQTAAIAFDRFKPLQDDACESRILAAKAALGKRAVILGHHYQRDEVIRFADFTGDSFKLARHIASRPEAEFIVFCGVAVKCTSGSLNTAAISGAVAVYERFNRSRMRRLAPERSAVPFPRFVLPPDPVTPPIVDDFARQNLANTCT